MIYTYLIKSLVDESFYVGISESPTRRLAEHNSGKLKTTAFKKPWKLVYSKDHIDYNEARKHESWLKKKNRRYKEFLAQLAPPWGAGGVK
jgi:putative endonuclease